jgi:hypothetical protein
MYKAQHYSKYFYNKIVLKHIIQNVRTLKSCGKEFNDLVDGIRYSSAVNGVLLFCSDDCCKNYLNVNKAAK